MNKFKHGCLFVISAPSGGGKTTLTEHVIKRLIDEKIPISKVITYTTRHPRPQEREGIDYYFLSESEFMNKQSSGDFLETTFYDNYWYGSPKSILESISQGNSFILVIDRAGAKSLKRLVPFAILIWITVPNKEILAQRLQLRGWQDNQENKKRIALAQQEMIEENQEHFFPDHIMNDNLDEAVNDLYKRIIQEIDINQRNT